MVDAIVAGIEAEDVEKHRLVQQRRQALQENIRNYLTEREAWKLEEQKRAEEELARIRQYNEVPKYTHIKQTC